MKHNNHAFTLIELLVVVLIIGILAAVALPQYQFAVAKSRLSSLMPIARHVKIALEHYYMTNQKYPDSLTQLDIDLPCINTDITTTCYLSEKVYIQWVSYYFNVIDNRINGVRLVYFPNGAGTCYAYDGKNQALANRLCKSISGLDNATDTWDGKSKYIIFE